MTGLGDMGSLSPRYPSSTVSSRDACGLLPSRPFLSSFWLWEDATEFGARDETAMVSCSLRSSFSAGVAGRRTASNGSAEWWMSPWLPRVGVGFTGGWIAPPLRAGGRLGDVWPTPSCMRRCGGMAWRTSAADGRSEGFFCSRRSTIAHQSGEYCVGRGLCLFLLMACPNEKRLLPWKGVSSVDSRYRRHPRDHMSTFSS
mmetsp:Transcript_11070/g.26772  ORF Transcript_11070/g.26772 Transcript_11070/m.26772 type:complete len:200 (-) Transcript_11070:683-1282(-)